MEFIQSLNWEQLGTAGLLVALLAFLLYQSEKERKYWQEKAFEGSEAYGEKLYKAISTIDTVMDLLKK